MIIDCINIGLSLITIVITIIITIGQNKIAKNTADTSQVLSEQANRLASLGNNIANYSANVQIQSNLLIQTVTDHDIQMFEMTKDNSYNITLKLSGYLTTTYGEISWIGMVAPDYNSIPVFSAEKMQENESINSNQHHFQMTFSINQHASSNDLVYSHVYVCALDSNFNISVLFIQLAIESIVTTKNVDEETGRGDIVLKGDSINGFKNVTGYYRCFTEYELLTYKTSKASKQWTNIQNTNTSNNQIFTTEWEKNDQSHDAILDELHEIRSYIKKVTD